MDSQDRKAGRVKQKLRTRTELLRAAAELAGQGLKPTVAEVADHAGISRATAYRYFSTPEDILREAALDIVARAIDPQSPVEGGGPKDVPAALENLVTQVFEMVLKDETMFRAMIANTVDKGSRRGGRRLGWISEVLEPLKPEMSKDNFERLKHSLSLLTGIETLIALKDVCGLDDAKAQDVTRWAAKALLAGALLQDK